MPSSVITISNIYCMRFWDLLNDLPNWSVSGQIYMGKGAHRQLEKPMIDIQVVSTYEEKLPCCRDVISAGLWRL